jgi:hypothetical protein
MDITMSRDAAPTSLQIAVSAADSAAAEADAAGVDAVGAAAEGLPAERSAAHAVEARIIAGSAMPTPKRRRTEVFTAPMVGETSSRVAPSGTRFPTRRRARH